jgi:membrane-associated phospholipid phosphatase
MKKIVLFMLTVSLALNAMAQADAPRASANYEAANWKTWLLQNPEQIVVTAPPSGAGAKAELQSVKQRINAVDEKKLAAIKYWDAGAPAYRWNQILPTFSQAKPAVMLRIPASWVNLAIYDATILAWKEKVKYKRQRPNAADRSLKPLINSPSTYSFPCEHTVTAAAASTVMAFFFPEKADTIFQIARAASQSRLDAGVQFQSDVDAGWKLGEDVAKQIIEQIKKDGSDGKWTGAINKDPKKWTGKFAMGINLQLVKPIVLRSADQFRPAAPPDFEKDMKELKNFKQTFRTRAIAFYWASQSETWNELAGKKMFEYRMSDDAPAVSRVYTVLNTAYHDMATAVFDAKYAYWGIRPVQYDTTFKPIVPTPPFPGYPSGHAAGAGTSCAVMSYFFPADVKEFKDMAQECADSRFYAGIHFRTDNETALVMGDAVGKFVVETWMKENKAVAGR